MSSSTSTGARDAKPSFEVLNFAYNSVFRPDSLTIGLVVPVENYSQSRLPSMHLQAERIQAVERLGFAAIWLRDVPFDVPSFGDAGQLYDPFVYLGLLAAHTQTIALGVASIVLPLRHPAHVAKAAASVDVLSGGRLLLGVASGDRPEEYPALGHSFEKRGERFRESFDYIRHMSEDSPSVNSRYGSLSGRIDMVPKPASGKLPLLLTGSSQQSPAWHARNGDGWLTYPRPPLVQEQSITKWREATVAAGRTQKPVMQPLYLDLVSDANAAPEPIHLGLRLGVSHLRDYLKTLQSIGVNHVALNLRFCQADIDTTLRRLADDVLPHFHN